MATKTDFTEEEWRDVLQAVVLSGVAISAADPSGLWGTLKEGFANAGILAKAKVDENANPLIKSIVEDFSTSEGRTFARDGLKENLLASKPEQVAVLSVERLGKVADLLDQKAPDDSAEVRQWLRGISQSVAEASKEGGFLGIGGVKVSDAEKATLDEISGALRVTV